MRRRLVWLGVAVAAGLALAVGLGIWLQPVEHSAVASPDGRFRLVIYRERTLMPSMPGQGSDAPGIVRLVDARTGRVLQEMPVEMIQLVQPVEWRPGHVSVRLLFDWTLPPPERP